MGAHLLAHQLDRHAEHLRGCDRVDILPVAEGIAHRLIARNVGQKPQLDLGIVRVHQHAALRRHEHAAKLAAQLRARGDILQIRLPRGKPPRIGDRHHKAGVDAPVRCNDLQQPVAVGGLELGILPVFQHVRDDRVLPAKLLQHVRVGRPAGFCLLAVRQLQLFKQDRAQLLGRIDVERPARGVVDTALQLPDTRFHQRAEVRERISIHKATRMLHLRQHGAQRQLDGKIKLLHAERGQFLLHGRAQRCDRRRLGREHGIAFRAPFFRVPAVLVQQRDLPVAIFCG